MVPNNGQTTNSMSVHLIGCSALMPPPKIAVHFQYIFGHPHSVCHSVPSLRRRCLLRTMSKLFVVVVCALVAVAVAKPGAGACGPPPNSKNPAECCAMPPLFDKAEMEACEAKSGKPKGGPAGQPHHGMSHCGAECLFNSTKTVTNGNIDAAAMKTYIKSHLNGATEWQPVLEKALDECMAESTQKKQPPQDTSGEGEHCDPKFGFIAMCVHLKAFNNCPASVYKPSPECDELKKASQSCNMMSGKMDG